MQEYTIITVPADLLPQIVGELLQFAVNPDHVDVFHGVHGREIHAHPEVANAWYQARQQKPATEPVPVQESAPEPAQGGATVTATAPVSDPDTNTSSVTVASGARPTSPAKATTAVRTTTAPSDKRTPSA